MEYEKIRIYGDGDEYFDINIGFILQDANSGEQNKARWGLHITQEIIKIRQLLQQQDVLKRLGIDPDLEALIGEPLHNDQIRLYQESLKGLEWLHKKMYGRDA